MKTSPMLIVSVGVFASGNTDTNGLNRPKIALKIDTFFVFVVNGNNRIFVYLLHCSQNRHKTAKEALVKINKRSGMNL